MITSNLDVLNLNASKPSLNKKADLSLDNSQAGGFGEELASFQKDNEGTLSENISLAAEALPNMKSPNQVSEENVKTLMENLNNFSGLEMVKDLGEEEQILAAEQMADQMNGTAMDAEAAKLALQGMVATPTPINNKSAEETASNMSSVGANPGFPQLNPQLKPATGKDAEVLEGGKFSIAGLEPVTPQVASPELAAAAAQANQSQTAAEAQTPATDKQVAEEIKKQSFESAKAKSAGAGTPSLEAMSLLQNLAPQSSAPAVADNSVATDVMPMMAVPQQNQTKNEAGDSKDFSSKDQERSVEVGPEQNFGAIVEKHKLTEAQVKLADVQAPKPSEAQHKSNMDQIVSHARTFLKDGGGEMVLKLTPEGMGTVDLKVGVKDGQVSIEINTQNEHVRKMFEEGVKDLRGALEVQNLKVDSLKINMADHVQKDMNMNQFNMSDKDFARNFMGQFRDERQGFRNQSLNGVMDKFHSPAKEPGGLRPAGLAMGNSSRLNVVA